MINRERQKIRAAYFGINITYCTLDEAILNLEMLKKKFGGEAMIKPDHRDSPCVYEYRDETDEEMAARIAAEERQEATQREREAAEYERLRKKFG